MLGYLGYQSRDLSILFVNNKRITELNNTYFGKNQPTNVISFSYLGGLPEEVMGDIIISVEKTEEEVYTSGINFYERLFSLIVHGIIHIMGYDHVHGGAEERKMRVRERQCMKFVQSNDYYRTLVKNHRTESVNG